MPATAGVLGAVALAAEKADELIVGAVRDIHGSVAQRAYAVTDTLADGTTLSHRLHDGVSTAVYGGIGLGLRSGAKALRAADQHLGPRLEDGPRGRFVVSVVNGLIGDRLRDRVPEMFFEPGVRSGGHDVPLTRDGLLAAYPGATDAVLVFVHGLCETEDYWRRRSRPRPKDASTAPSYGDRLAAEGGWTPVYVRINTGLPLTENGVALSAMLAALTEHWPVEVRRIALVGHSLGGLVVRAAGAVATDAEWTSRVTDVVTLGAPHLGAPLERVVDKGTRLLGRVPEAAPFARILDQRSIGILDLRHGLAGEVVNLPNARYHLVAASLTRSPRHPVALAIGDLLVQPRSALGRPRRGAEMFPGADLLHVPGADHFDLLNHDDVYAALRIWLADPPPEESP